MAQVPNYYFNNQAIGDAARNLASALAPPDPARQLAVRKMQFEFDQEQEAARLKELDRANRDIANDSLNQLLSMSPVVDAATGKIDENATDQQARELFGKVVQYGGREYFDAGSKAAGTASPAYAAQEALKQLGIQNAQWQTLQRIGAQFQLQDRGFQQRSLLQEDDQDFRAGQQSQRIQADFEKQAARLKAQAEAARLKGAGGAGKPPVVYGRLQEDILMALLTKVNTSGKRISQEDFDKLLSKANGYAQQTRDAQTGANIAWDEAFPGASSYIGAGEIGERPAPPATNWWQRFGNFMGGAPQDDGFLHPQFDAPPASLGGVVAPPTPEPVLPPMMPPGMPPTSAPLAPPAAEAPPPAAAPRKSATPPRVPRGSADLPRPKNKQEYDALPKGTRFIDPNGETRVKP